MNYVTGTRRPIIVKKGSLRTTPKKSDNLKKEFELLRKHMIKNPDGSIEITNVIICDE